MTGVEEVTWVISLTGVTNMTAMTGVTRVAGTTGKTDATAEIGVVGMADIVSDRCDSRDRCDSWHACSVLSGKCSLVRLELMKVVRKNADFTRPRSFNSFFNTYEVIQTSLLYYLSSH